MVLLRDPRTWEVVSDGPFQSGPETLVLNPQAVDADAAATIKLPISLRLVAASTTDLPELWVLHDRPLDRLRALAEHTDNRLLGRLSVAIGSVDGRQVVVLRAQPGRSGPPILVLDALACQPILRMPNLYSPIGFRLQPPIRRDAVRQLLAADAESVMWLEPGESGAFAVHSMPEFAFRPLDEAIAYVQDRDAEPLTPVVVGQPFALTAFVVRDAAKPPSRRLAPAPAESPAETPKETPEQTGVLSRIVRWFAPRPGESAPGRRPQTVEPAENIDRPPRSLDTGEDQRRALEDRLIAAMNNPDDPERAALWPELGRLYAILSRPADAAMCWLNAFWESDDPPPQWGRGWLRAEARIARGTDSGADLRRWLAAPPSQAIVRVIAAAAAQQPPPPALIGASDRVHRLLDEHEDWLPVRAAWLARLGLNRLTGGDTIGVARTRDRLLARLHEHGLSADLDVPAAVRFAGQGAGDRVETVRTWLSRAHDPIHRWLSSGEVVRSWGGEAVRPTNPPPHDPTTSPSHDPGLHAFGLGTAAAPTRRMPI